jgi:GNAT superfamily N-acetyltransferase
MNPDITFTMLSPETWGDFEKFFDRYRGCAGCWCTYHLCSLTQFNQMRPEERKAFHKDLVFNGQASGILVSDNGEPAAWCQFGPAERYPHFDRKRTYRALAIPPDLSPQWRISCFFVDRSHRRQGLSGLALHAALDWIHNHGGGIVEAFPRVLADFGIPKYTGSVPMFEKEGFRPLASLGKYIRLMKLYP